MRSITAVAIALAGVFLADLAWAAMPLPRGLAFGHGMLAAIIGLALLRDAVHLERQHADWPRPGNTRGAGLLSFAILLLADATHAFLYAVRGVNEFPTVMAAGFVAAILLHGVVELATLPKGVSTPIPN